MAWQGGSALWISTMQNRCADHCFVRCCSVKHGLTPTRTWQVKYTYDSVVEGLRVDSRRKFIFVESACELSEMHREEEATTAQHRTAHGC